MSRGHRARNRLLTALIGALLASLAAAGAIGQTTRGGGEPSAPGRADSPSPSGSPAGPDQPAGEHSPDLPGESPTGPTEPAPPAAPDEPEPIRWRASHALGRPTRGRLVRGVQLPAEGPLFFTWDPIERSSPNRGWRRFGTDRLLRTTLQVLARFRRRHPDAPRVGIGDLSRRHGGDFGPRFGLPGHASHQNGLDVDVYYPRLDRLEREPATPRQVDRRLAQDLVDRFVRAGARFVFVGYHVGLRGPRRIVQRIPHHENHLHVRLPPSG